MESATVPAAPVDVIAAAIAATIVSHVVLRRAISGPAAPRAVLSMTCGLIAAAALAFAALAR